MNPTPLEDMPQVLVKCKYSGGVDVGGRPELEIVQIHIDHPPVTQRNDSHGYLSPTCSKSNESCKTMDDAAQVEGMSKALEVQFFLVRIGSRLEVPGLDASKMGTSKVLDVPFRLVRIDRSLQLFDDFEANRAPGGTSKVLEVLFLLVRLGRSLEAPRCIESHLHDSDDCFSHLKAMVHDPCFGPSIGSTAGSVPYRMFGIEAMHTYAGLARLFICIMSRYIDSTCSVQGVLDVHCAFPPRGLSISSPIAFYPVVFVVVAIVVLMVGVGVMNFAVSIMLTFVLI